METELFSAQFLICITSVHFISDEMPNREILKTINNC